MTDDNFTIERNPYGPLEDGGVLGIENQYCGAVGNMQTHFDLKEVAISRGLAMWCISDERILCILR